MKARRTFFLDLERSARPRVARGGGAPVMGMTHPSEGFQRGRGLRFSAGGRGLLYWNRGKLNDAAGALLLEFLLDEGDAGGILARTFGNYFLLSARPRGAECDLHLRFYGHDLRLLAPRHGERPLRVRVSWNSSTGFRLSAGGISLARNVAWHAYLQRSVPLEIGGAINELRPHRIRWTEVFHGWIRRVECRSAPVERPSVSPREQREILTLRATPPQRAPAMPRSLTLVDFHDPPIVESPIRFDSIPDRPANFRACQRAHPELARLYHGARNAFEGVLAIGRHIANLWPHTSYWPWPRAIFEERGDRLLAGIKRGEVCGMCGGYAHTMEEALWALGVPARRTQVINHSSLEVYDHFHDKWICLEVDNAGGHAGCWLDSRGRPFSIGELIVLLERDRGEPGIFRREARHLSLGVPCPGGSIHYAQPESWARHCYLFMGWFQRRDYGVKEAPKSWWYYPRWYLPSRLDPHSPPAGQRRVSDPRHLYWSCNRVRVRMDWRRAPAEIRLQLEPFQTQFFDSFEIRVNGQRVTHRGAHFLWRLNVGLNACSISARSQLGAIGHPWRALIIRRR